jgi:uncharacterized protein
MNAYKLERLAERVEKQAYLRHSRVHGEHHWRKVAWTGLELAQQTSGADPELVFLFALLHDCKRLNEWGDKDHGKRAADWAKQLTLGLDKRRMGTLQEALVWHDDGYVDTDPTIGCCWDADRLQLRRVGTEPDLKLLSKLGPDFGRARRATPTPNRGAGSMTDSPHRPKKKSRRSIQDFGSYRYDVA